MSRPLWFIKDCLEKEFDAWRKECPHTRKNDAKDVIEFLIQIGLLKGKYFNDYIDMLPPLEFPKYIELGACQPLLEGFIPPRTWFGRKNKKIKEEKPAEDAGFKKLRKSEEAMCDLEFSMVISEENQGPIVIKKETAENIIEILKKIQEL